MVEIRVEVASKAASRRCWRYKYCYCGSFSPVDFMFTLLLREGGFWERLSRAALGAQGLIRELWPCRSKHLL